MSILAAFLVPPAVQLAYVVLAEKFDWPEALSALSFWVSATIGFSFIVLVWRRAAFSMAVFYFPIMLGLLFLWSYGVIVWFFRGPLQ
jgi:hypothetical protein